MSFLPGIKYFHLLIWTRGRNLDCLLALSPWFLFLTELIWDLALFNAYKGFL